MHFVRTQCNCVLQRETVGGFYRMKFRNRWLRRLAGFSVASFTRGWMSTIDCKVAYYDPSVDPAGDDEPAEVVAP